VETPVTVDVSEETQLEARLASPPGAHAGLVISHPHPLYGGDMDNPVVIRVAEVAQAIGVATLRFNFRGVGASTGKHGEGEAEQDDVRAALAMLAGRLPAGSAVGLAGYSFGAWVAAGVVAGGTEVAALGLVAPPLEMRDLDALVRVPEPTLIVAGTKDQYCPVDALRQLGRRLGIEATFIEGAEHFFFGKLFPLGEVVERWLRRWAV
jgi:alpha/beta superfamily hydrolase